MASFKQIREGIAANLATVQFASGVRPQVSAAMLANPTPPGIQVFPGPLTYDLAFNRGLDTPTFVVQAFVAYSTDLGSQTLLDELCAPAGAGSIKSAVESDRTLGGLVAALRVTEMTGYRVAAVEAGTLLVADWNVTVWDDDN